IVGLMAGSAQCVQRYGGWGGVRLFVQTRPLIAVLDAQVKSPAAGLLLQRQHARHVVLDLLRKGVIEGSGLLQLFGVVVREASDDLQVLGALGENLVEELDAVSEVVNDF